MSVRARMECKQTIGSNGDVEPVYAATAAALPELLPTVD